MRAACALLARLRACSSSRRERSIAARSARPERRRRVGTRGHPALDRPLSEKEGSRFSAGAWPPMAL